MRAIEPKSILLITIGKNSNSKGIGLVEAKNYQ